MDAHDASTEAPESQAPDEQAVAPAVDAIAPGRLSSPDEAGAREPGLDAASEMVAAPDAETMTPMTPMTPMAATASGETTEIPNPTVSAEIPALVDRLERDDMAWPPALWERTPGAWRDDVWTGPAPFQPAATGDLPSAGPELPPAAATGGSRRLAREIVETAILTLIIFLGIKLVVQNFKIQGASMEKTLHDGQFLLVNRLPHYGIGEPERGDIVVFKAWEQGTGAEERDFIKRVIGKPGETIEIRDNSVYVNDAVLPEPYLDPGNLTTDRIGPITLSEDEYYVMGDNRGNSSDSRTYGPLKKDRIIGKAWLSYWPPGNIGIVPDSQSSFAAAPVP
jgi:signal peptidase I